MVRNVALESKNAEAGRDVRDHLSQQEFYRRRFHGSQVSAPQASKAQVLAGWLCFFPDLPHCA